jgi:hypothetical protein
MAIEREWYVDDVDRGWHRVEQAFRDERPAPYRDWLHYEPEEATP